jgi:hypothetical protein
LKLTDFLSIIDLIKAIGINGEGETRKEEILKNFSKNIPSVKNRSNPCLTWGDLHTNGQKSCQWYIYL